MRTLIQSIFGVYTPLLDSQGQVIKGISGVDFEYLVGVFLFGICLFSIFRILGVVIKNV